MTAWAGAIRNEKGVALPLALFALVMLSGLLVAFLSMGGMEPQIAANLGDVTRARYVAEAGIEWAFDQLKSNTNWSGVLLGTDGQANTTDDGRLAANMMIQGLTANSGTFSVQVRNDNQAGDTTLTGAPLDTGGATNDSNGVLIVAATGNLSNGTSRQIQAVIRRIQIPPLPAPVACTGVQCDYDTGILNANDDDDGAAHFHSDGRDYLRDGNRTGNTKYLKYALSAPTGSQASTGKPFEQMLEDALTNHQENEMDGLDAGNPGRSVQRWNGEGKRTIAGTNSLTSQQITDFVNLVKSQPGIKPIMTNMAKPLLISNCTKPADSGCAGVDLGTVSKPSITYIRGSTDPQDRYTSVQISGNTSGAGILILEDADMSIANTFRWDGVIIVTGRNVGVTFKKYSRSYIYGGLVVDEKDPQERGGSYELLIEKNYHGDSGSDQFTTFYSSQQNMDMANGIQGLVRLSTWREM